MGCCCKVAAQGTSAHLSSFAVLIPLRRPRVALIGSQVAAEGSPPPGMAAVLLWFAPSACPGALHSLAGRKATVASCADFSSPLALSSPWSAGQ